ncbi:hypothetical protein NHP21005_09610 [Helicobacter sp. NHP21005]|uniref:hypothetical protein n=1 Tax=Helicobacter felistomachi TaxID=3040201 RepID=UPI002573FFB6|nr:hypothetical protein [Helicobacter sp. NHP21005]BEG57273.1 hypothetical protein NHP21005_09610 [Helicobacter sp. NHP21005]
MQIDKLTYDKNEDRGALKTLLLLFNLEYIITKTKSSLFEFNRFVLEKWNLEHLYAQNSESVWSKKERGDLMELREEVRNIEDLEKIKKLKKEESKVIKNGSQGLSKAENIAHEIERKLKNWTKSSQIDKMDEGVVCNLNSLLKDKEEKD